MKKVRVISTVGQKLNVIESNATTWGELKSDLSSRGYELSSTKAIVGETQNTLEQTDAILPVTDFSLFILPSKTKSGSGSVSVSYKELREQIKSIKSSISKEEFKSAFGDYTHLTTAQLASVLNKYNSSKSVSKIIDIPALKENTVTITIPVSLIPAGIYTNALSEDEANALSSKLQ